MKLPASVETWWNSQGGEIARREMTWAWGWVRSREGAGLIIGITACSFGYQFHTLFYNEYFWHYGRLMMNGPYIFELLWEFFVNLRAGLLVVYYVLLFLLAFRLLQLRIWPAFESIRLRDMVMTDIQSTSVWPAMLAGPAVVWACVAAADELSSFLLWAFPPAHAANFESWMAHMFDEEVALVSVRPGVLFAIGWGRFIAAPLFVLSFTIAKLFPMALAARFSILETRGFARLSTALFALLLTIWLPVSAHWFQDAPTVNRDLISYYWTQPLVQGLVCGLLLLAVLHRLRSPRLWERLREKAEALS